MAIRKYNKKGEEYSFEKIKKAISKDELVLFGNYPFDCAKKLILWNKISDMYKDIQWIYDKKGELRVENFDASDSLVCILGQIGKEQFENTKPRIVDYSEALENNLKIINYTVEFCNKNFSKTIEL